jgi:hypothetical protein
MDPVVDPLSDIFVTMGDDSRPRTRHCHRASQQTLGRVWHVTQAARKGWHLHDGSSC